MKIANKIITSGGVFAVLSMAISGMNLIPEASAHISPAGCNANNLNLNISQTPPGVISDGQTINYTVTVSNPAGGGSCDTTAVSITLVTPDGVAHKLCDPTQAGQTPANCDFPAGTADVVYAPVSYTVNCPTGPVITATAAANDKLHDSTNDDIFSISKALSTNVNCAHPPVGGQILSMDASTLFIAGVSANASWMIPTLIAAIGGGTATAIGLRRRKTTN